MEKEKEKINLHILADQEEMSGEMAAGALMYALLSHGFEVEIRTTKKIFIEIYAYFFVGYESMERPFVITRAINKKSSLSFREIEKMIDNTISTAKNYGGLVS